MRTVAALLLLLSTADCTGVHLNRAALRAETRAQLLAERGDGVGAARERDRAMSLRLRAKSRERRADWLNR